MASCKEGVINLLLLYLKVVGPQEEEKIIEQMSNFLNKLHRVKIPETKEALTEYNKWRQTNLKIKERYLKSLLGEIENTYISRRPHALVKECLELNEQGKRRVEQLLHSDIFLTYYDQHAQVKKRHFYSFKEFDDRAFKDALVHTALLYVKDFLIKTKQEPWRPNKLIIYLEGLLPVEHIFHIIDTLKKRKIIRAGEDGNYITEKAAVP